MSPTNQQPVPDTLHSDIELQHDMAESTPLDGATHVDSSTVMSSSPRPTIDSHGSCNNHTPTELRDLSTFPTASGLPSQPHPESNVHPMTTRTFLFYFLGTCGLYVFVIV
ncbi:hypothetical protein V6N13_105504 [Hibiscus sabdariffa]